jgi:nitrite reductase/ring-hydroxylating ferredoxin subunit/DMSO/TMAO reductase YedYZ heme-binding membrane subunit
VSHQYRAIGWNAHKRVYDAVSASVASALLLIVGLGTAWRLPAVTAETLVLRSTGVTAFLLLHVILSIGPLCRLDRRFLPLLYNRRHLGVLMFLLAATHGVLALVQFHAGGDRNPLVSLLTTSRSWLEPSGFPFHIPGALALGWLFVMAATSHDFWLRTLTAPVWKTLHMGVYLVYACLVVHVAFGVVQSEVPAWTAWVVAAGVGWLGTLHTWAAFREAPVDRTDVPEPVEHTSHDAAGPRLLRDPGWIDAGPVDRIPEKRGRIVCAAGERIAVFRYDGKVSAISNVCQHQNGPLGEGKIVGGCVVCPWHGYEYDPETGAAPPPFVEAVPTFRVAVRDGRVFVDPRPLPPGTRVPPARIDDDAR